MLPRVCCFTLSRVYVARGLGNGLSERGEQVNHQEQVAYGDQLRREARLALVRRVSVDLMNTGKGDGTIAMTYDDDEIMAKFGHLTDTGAKRKVAKIDAGHAEVVNEVWASSGEYDFPAGRQPVRKTYNEEVTR